MNRVDGGPNRHRHRCSTIHGLSTALETRGSACAEWNWAKKSERTSTLAIQRSGRKKGDARRIQTLSASLSTPCEHPAPARLKVALGPVVGGQWPRQHSDGNTYGTEDQGTRSVNFQHRVQTPQSLADGAIFGVVLRRFFSAVP